MLRKYRRFWSIGIGGIAIVIAALTVKLYSVFLADNVAAVRRVRVNIPSGASFDSLIAILSRDSILVSYTTFRQAARLTGTDKRIRPGSYRINPEMNNRSLLRIFRMGLQAPVRVTFTSVRLPADLAAKVSAQLELDSASLASAITSDSVARRFGFSRESFLAMFIPNTYEFYWNTDTEAFLKRMKREYGLFWNETRLKKAGDIGLSPVEVSVLASIVEEETRFNSEKSRIAGVYLNRLRKGIPLQADPTVKFAVGNFALRRILTRHLKVDSPYNTYRYRGLPPGPIRTPSISSIDAVLNAEKHHFLYFCARPDFSGYHLFSKTLREHNRNAAKYRRALNRERIYR